MKEPTLLTLPDLSFETERVPMASSKSAKTALTPGISASILFHVLLFSAVLLSGVFTPEPPPSKSAAPILRAVMITPAQLEHLRVIPEATVKDEPSDANEVPEPDKEIPAQPKKPVEAATKEVDDSVRDKPKVDPFAHINERLERAHAAQRLDKEQPKESVDDLVRKLKATQSKREEWIDSIEEVTRTISSTEPLVGTDPVIEPEIVEAPEAIGDQEVASSMVMDPLFLYQKQIAEKIRSYMRISDSIRGECRLGLSLSRDGHVIEIRALSGNDRICQAATRAAIRADIFSMPDDESLYNQLSKLQVTVRPVMSLDEA